MHSFKRLAPNIERIEEKKESGSISRIMEDFDKTKREKSKLEEQVKNLEMEVLMLK